MNKDDARKLIAIVAAKKLEGYTKNDFLTSLSFKRALIPPDLIDRFIEGCLKDKLLVEKNGKYIPNFNSDGVIVPLDFTVDPDRLFMDSGERPLIDRLLDTAASSGRMTKKEAIVRAKELIKNMRYIDIETAIITVLSDNNIDVRQFVLEKEKNILRNQ
ncbi:MULTISPECIES: DUF2240 family protein [Acidiplasma]|uniref:DUF2240 domain-containing protein n=1 Tax=Acidiplasma aeolicum TaxID=507754 RepID=A0A0N8PQ99_9ARCH|nr:MULTISPECIES: DUF2240 family protein [Acidiplasma]KJE49235.1 hypothetical protein TZ01_03980 [Acidiplasma sp. MBA-1]KPV46533.1 hypothetical protein SE19_05115 [Acidiplasma aeolicum]WMT54799.1 MAG: DUF2240 family protein [Acidiplasma sp.]